MRIPTIGYQTNDNVAICATSNNRLCRRDFWWLCKWM